MSASAESRQAKERTARKACLNGDFVKGVSILSDLFVDSKDPTYIYNQGRCFEQNRRYEDAIARFEEYLRTDLNPQSRAQAEKHLADSQKKLDQERESAAILPAPAAAPQPVYVPVPAAAPPAEPAPTVTVPVTPAQPGPRRWGLITAGIVTGTVGVGAAVVGLLYNLKANNMVKDWESKPTYTSSNETKQNNYRTITWIGYGAGAALVATGTILIAVGAASRTSSSSGDVALAPTFGPGQVGAMLTGAF